MKNLGYGFAFFALLGAFTTSWGQDSSKESLYLQAIKADSNNEMAYFNLGVVYLNDQKFDLAIPQFEKCLQLKSSDTQAREFLESCKGMVALNKGDNSTAISHFQEVLKMNSGNSQARYYLLICQAHVDMDGKNYAQAVTVYKQIIEIDPKDFSAYHNLGFAYFQQKDYKQAAENWTHFLKLRDDVDIHKYLGFSYYNLGNFNEAIEQYKKAIAMESAKDPKDQDKDFLDVTYYNLGVAYNDNGSFDEAMDAFAMAFKVNPKDSNAAAGQAQALDEAVNDHLQKAANGMLSNQYSDVIAEAQKVIVLQSGNPQAQEFIKDAQAKMDEGVEKHYAAGKAYYLKGNTLQALNEWNLALQMDPNNEKVQKAIHSARFNTSSRIKALVAEGDEAFEGKDYAGALASYRKASEIDPNNKSVKKSLKRLISVQSNEKDSNYTKALRYDAKGDLKDAQKYISLAKEIAPKDEKVAEAFFRIQKDISVRVKSLDDDGVSLFEGGDKDKAQAKFQEVLRLKSNDETANDYVKRLTGKQSQEKVDAENVKSLYYEGVNLYINGKITEAIAKWKECKRLDPNNVNAQSNIDKAMAKLQSIEKFSHN